MRIFWRKLWIELISKVYKKQIDCIYLTIEGAPFFSKTLGPSLTISSIIEDINAGHEVPPYFMMNTMKADYLAARWLAFTSLYNDNFPESGYYADTLDYALYGIKYSLITHAQRIAFDILDKIAVAVANYLGFKKPEKASFRSIWHIYKGESSEDSSYFPKKIQNWDRRRQSSINSFIWRSQTIWTIKDTCVSKKRCGIHLRTDLPSCMSSWEIIEILDVSAIFWYYGLRKRIDWNASTKGASLIYFVEMVALKECCGKETIRNLFLF